VRNPRIPLSGRSYSKPPIAILTVLFICLMFLALSCGPLFFQHGIARTSAVVPIFSSAIRVNDNVNEYTAQANPDSALLPNGKLFVVWRDERNGKKDVYSSLSNENINYFSPNKKINVRSSDFTNHLYPAIAFCKNNVYVVWEENYYSTFHHHIMFSRSTDGGSTFGPNIRVDDMPLNVNSQEKPSITVAEDGTVIVAWINFIDNSTVSRVRFAIYDPLSNSFSPNFELPNYFVSSSRQTSVSLVTNRNYVYVGYLDDWSGLPHPYITWSDDACRSFLPKKPLQLDICDNPAAYQQELSLAAYPKGAVVAIWSDNRNGDWDIYGALVHRYRGLIGENFRVDDGPKGTLQRNPTIAIDANNGIYAAWSDDRYSDSDYTTWGIRFAYASCGNLPIAFTPSVSVLSPKRGEDQMSPSIAVGGPNNIYITYSRIEDKATQPDIYMSAGVLSVTSSASSTANILTAFLTSAASMAFVIAKEETRNRKREILPKIHSLPVAVRAVSGTALILR